METTTFEKVDETLFVAPLRFTSAHRSFGQYYTAFCFLFQRFCTPRKLTDDEKTEVKQQIADYHKYHRLVREGDFYRLVSPTENVIEGF